MRFNTKVFMICLGLVASAWAATAMDNYQLGNSQYQQGQWEKAVASYQAAVDMDPQLWQAYSGLGNAQYKLGRKTEALASYDKSLGIHPDNPNLKNFVDKIRPPSANSSYTTAAGLPELSGPLATAPASSSTTAGEWKPQNKVATRSSLPTAGKVAWNFGVSSDLFGAGDFQDFYGPGLTVNDIPYGAELYLGVDFTLSPAFQLGGQFQGIFKAPVAVSSGFATQTWNSHAIGGVVVGKTLISLSSNINLIFFAEAGFYTLVFSSLEDSVFGTIDLAASGFGGTAGAEVEILQDVKGTWALDIGLGYRFAPLSPVNANYQGTDLGDLLNYDNSDARIDFSGFRLSAGLRFY